MATSSKHSFVSTQRFCSYLQLLSQSVREVQSLQAKLHETNETEPTILMLCLSNFQDSAKVQEPFSVENDFSSTGKMSHSSQKQKGCLDQLLIRDWVNQIKWQSRCEGQEFVRQAVGLHEINEVFKVQSISFSLVISECLRGFERREPSDSQLSKYQFPEIEEGVGQSPCKLPLKSVIQTILHRRVVVSRLRSKILPEFEHHIPFVGKHLTAQELHEFMSCQLLEKSVLDLEEAARAVLKGLNNWQQAKGSEGERILLFRTIKEEQNLPSIDATQVLENNQSQVNRVNSILERLTLRVHNFGRAWINEAQQLNIVQRYF